MQVGLAFAVVLALLAAANAQSNNVSWGDRRLGDSHLSRQIVHHASSFLRKVESDYIFEQKNTAYPKTITQVVITDQYTNGKGGFATLTSGGPSMPFVKVHMRSQRNRGFNFIVDIYGM